LWVWSIAYDVLFLCVRFKGLAVHVGDSIVYFQSTCSDSADRLIQVCDGIVTRLMLGMG
jgi:hypothetical protein